MTVLHRTSSRCGRWLIAALMLLALKAGAKPLQDTAMRVTLKAANIPLEDVLLRIENQTGFTFVYSTQLINGAEKVTVNFQRTPLMQALRQLLDGRGLRWLVREQGIVLLPGEAPPAPVHTAAKPVVKGVVKDAQSGAIPGVTVRVKHTDKGTITDESGSFAVQADAGSTLEFSMVGYQRISVAAGGTGLLHVTLPEDVARLSEMVVKGYYTTTRALNTGSVSTISGSDIASLPVGDPLAALAGRAPGLLVWQDRGIPGRSARVQLRGINSISNRNDPLYLVNGVPYPSQSLSATQFGGGTGYQGPLNSLNLADIESITVLKDADATAIYGSQGANGVILITTKKGEAGSARVDAAYNTGWGVVGHRLKLLDTQQYLAMRHEAFRNDNLRVSSLDYDLNGVWDTTRYTNWQDVLIGETGRVNDARIRISGGSEHTSAYIGVGYRKETTVFPGDFFDRKLSFNAGADHASANNRLKAGFSFMHVNNENQMPETDLTSFIMQAPDAPAAYDSAGRLNWQKNTWTNPLAQLYRNNKTVTNSSLGSAMLSYEIVRGLVLKGTLGMNQLSHRQRLLQPAAAQPPSRQNIPDIRVNQTSSNRLTTWVAEPQLLYDTRLGQGRIEMLIGATFRESRQDVLTQRASNFSDDALMENIRNARTLSVLYAGNTLYRYNAAYGRVGYTLRDRYVLNLTARRDGSSRFGPGKQFGNFGAAGAAWIFSREKFMEALAPAISFGKIRVSTGTTGNDQLPDYQYLSIYENMLPGYVYQDNTAIVPTRLQNPDFGWEEVSKLEAAIDLGLFAGNVQLTAGWYRNRTNNQLVGLPLPQMTGFSTVQANLPAVVQNTGVELEVSATLASRKQFNWVASANVSFPRNKLLSYPGFEYSAYRYSYEVGKSMSGTYRFHYTGINPATGLFTFEDLDGDGVVTANGDRRFVATESKFHGGVSSRLQWKKFEVSFLWQFMQKKSSLPRYYNGPGVNNMNQPVGVLDRWQEKGDEGNYVQRYSTSFNQQTQFFDLSDAVIADASFLRLKNLYLGYTLPRLLGSGLKVYVQGRNLWTLTKFEGLDPEPASSGLNLPPVKVFAAGVQLAL